VGGLADYLRGRASKAVWHDVARLRVGNHGLGVETGRWTRTEFSQRKCARCTSAGIADAPVDDTHHVIFSCVSTARLRLVPDFAELFDDMQEFMSHSKAIEFVKLCMRDIAVAGPAREQQGPAVHIRAGSEMV
jgi:hypothetical protein